MEKVELEAAVEDFIRRLERITGARVKRFFLHACLDNGKCIEMRLPPWEVLDVKISNLRLFVGVATLIAAGVAYWRAFGNFGRFRR